MSEKFKAIVLDLAGEQFSREIKTLNKSFFKVGDVLVKIDYSGLNYMDALILKLTVLHEQKQFEQFLLLHHLHHNTLLWLEVRTPYTNRRKTAQ